jgi:hypothetical protein
MQPFLCAQLGSAAARPASTVQLIIQGVDKYNAFLIFGVSPSTYTHTSPGLPDVELSLLALTHPSLVFFFLHPFFIFIFLGWGGKSQQL